MDEILIPDGKKPVMNSQGEIEIVDDTSDEDQNICLSCEG